MLALALVFVFTLTALAAATLQLSRATTLRQATSTNHKLAFYMAESGLAEAYVGLMIGKTGKVGSEHEPAVLGDGLFWVEAREDLEEGTVTLDCTAMVGNGRAILSMVVERGEPSVAGLGMFSDAILDVQPGSLVDGFDSSDGPYVAPAPVQKKTLPSPEGETESSPPPAGLGKMGWVSGEVSSRLPFHHGGRRGARRIRSRRRHSRHQPERMGRRECWPCGPSGGEPRERPVARAPGRPGGQSRW